MAIYKNSYPFGSIVRNGLVLSLDATNLSSYPGSGNIWYDTSGNGNSGSFVSGAYNDMVRGRSSVVFDGINDYVDLGTSLGNNFTSITVDVWTKPTSVITGSYVKRSLISGDDGSSSGLESIYCMFETNFNSVINLPSSFIGRSLSFGIRTATQADRARTIGIADESGFAVWLNGIAIYMNPVEYNTSTWINVTGVYNGVNTLLYVNSVLKATSANQPDGVNRSVSGSLNSTSMLRAISSDAGLYNFYNGNTSAVKFYNRALTAAEVQQNFNALRNRFGI